MDAPVLNLADIHPEPFPAPYAPTGPAALIYAPRVARIGARLGSARLGVNLIALAPGKRAFPFHNHRANDELFHVLQGEGELRLGTEVHPLRAGDLVACPAGGPETAHQIVNTGKAELRYLAYGTNSLPDVIEYPDSGLYKTMAAPAAEGEPPFHAIGRLDRNEDYWA